MDKMRQQQKEANAPVIQGRVEESKEQSANTGLGEGSVNGAELKGTRTTEYQGNPYDIDRVNTRESFKQPV